MKDVNMEITNASIDIPVTYTVDEVAEMYGVLSDGMHLEELHRLLTDFQGLYVSIFGVLPRIRP